MLNLEENEKLIAVFRKHIFYVIMRIFGLVFVALIPFLVYQFIKPFISEGISPVSGSFFIFVYFVFLTILWIVCFMIWTDHYLDMWILTDKRLIDIEQKGLFWREISSVRLDRIQDIKLEISGFIHTFINIGSVHVQTAGSEKEFVIHSAKEPSRVKELVLSAHNKQADEIKTVRIEG